MYGFGILRAAASSLLAMIVAMACLANVPKHTIKAIPVMAYLSLILGPLCTENYLQEQRTKPRSPMKYCVTTDVKPR